MEQRKLTFSDILNKENENRLFTIERHGKFFIISALAIDLLVKLSYMNLDNPVDPLDNEYRVFVQYHYYNLISSLRSAMILFEHAYYEDAFRIMRGLMETLVKIKYFLDHKEDLLSYEKSQKDSMDKWLSIKEIFNSVTGDDILYDRYYKLLCQFVHDNLGQKIATVRRKENDGEHIIVPSYNKQSAEMYINFSLYILLGYLNLFGLFLNIDEEKIKRDLGDDYLKVKNDLLSILKQHKVQFEHQKEFHEVFSKIIDIKL